MWWNQVQKTQDLPQDCILKGAVCPTPHTGNFRAKLKLDRCGHTQHLASTSSFGTANALDMILARQKIDSIRTVVQLRRCIAKAKDNKAKPDTAYCLDLLETGEAHTSTPTLARHRRMHNILCALSAPCKSRIWESVARTASDR